MVNKMSCSKSHSNINKKPVDTKTKTHIWSTIKNNPNLYCWIPVKKKGINLQDVNLDEVSIQDIPPLPEYTDMIDAIGQLASGEADAGRMKNLKKGIDVVSADDPRKYPIIKKFIIERGLKLYGGAAINMYMPPDKKFYRRGEIPDYDVYSSDPWKDAVDLGDLLYSKGYKYVEVKSGMHPGTYKVFANFWPVADITYIPPKLFKLIKTRKRQGFDVVGPIRLMDEMYKELTLPYADTSRWGKVATRQDLLYKYSSPIPKNINCSKSFFEGKSDVDPRVAPLLSRSIRFIHDNKLILSGNMAYNMYMAVGGARRRVQVHYCSAISEHAHTDIQMLMTELSSLVDPKKLKITTVVRRSREINPALYRISLCTGKKLLPVCVIVQTSECTQYKKILNEYVVSIDYLKYTLYNDASFAEKSSTTKDKLCLVKYLNKVQNNYYVTQNVNQFDDTPFQRFIIKCKGPNQNNIKRILEKRWNTPKNIPVLPECVDAPEDKCKYPCAWNKHEMKCGNVPKKVYKPSK